MLGLLTAARSTGCVKQNMGEMAWHAYSGWGVAGENVFGGDLQR